MVRRSQSRVRYAVVGLGYIAQVAVLPAFAHAARNSALVALVSGDPKKRRVLGRKYDVLRAVDYADYDALLRSGDVDAVYIALPNSMHADYTIRAAKAGVHVLCEKPLATTRSDAERMVEECRRHGVKLMTAYRLHFEAANLGALETVRSGRIGEPRLFHGLFSMQVEPGNSRLKHALGGGPLFDLGIYCLNAARTLFGAEPQQAFGYVSTSGDPRFDEVEESVTAALRFPGGRLASFSASFGAADASWYEVVGTKGRLRVDPAYEYAEPLKVRVTVGGRTTEREYVRRDQFAPELLHFSDCVIEDLSPEPSGREGLADLRVIQAIFDAARTGRTVSLAPFDRLRHPDPSKEIRRSPVERPALIHATQPHR